MAGDSAPSVSDLSSPVWAESENQADSMTPGTSDQSVLLVWLPLERQEISIRFAWVAGACDPYQNPEPILRGFGGVQEAAAQTGAQDGGDLAWCPTPRHHRRRAQLC